MATQFGWQYSLSEDFNFPGGLLPRINKLYAERASQYPEVSEFEQVCCTIVCLI